MERTLLSAAFDLDFDLALDLDFALDLLDECTARRSAVEERRFSAA